MRQKAARKTQSASGDSGQKKNKKSGNEWSTQETHNKLFQMKEAKRGRKNGRSIAGENTRRGEDEKLNLRKLKENLE